MSGVVNFLKLTILILYLYKIIVLLVFILNRNYQDVAENIELIRLQQDKKAKSTVLTTLKAQIQALEEEVVKYKTDIDKLRLENSDLSTSLSEEQRKAINLAAELSNNSRYVPIRKFEFSTLFCKTSPNMYIHIK